jgi:hypothetical protein
MTEFVDTFRAMIELNESPKMILFLGEWRKTADEAVQDLKSSITEELLNRHFWSEMNISIQFLTAEEALDRARDHAYSDAMDAEFDIYDFDDFRDD